MQKIYLQLLVRYIWNASTKMQNKCHLKCQWSYRYSSDSVHFTVSVTQKFLIFSILIPIYSILCLLLNQFWCILQTYNKFHPVQNLNYDMNFLNIPSLLSSLNFCFLIRIIFQEINYKMLWHL
jgi:hypothetical protein